MRFTNQISQNVTLRVAAAVIMAALLLGSVEMPTPARAGSVVPAGSAIVSGEASETASVETTPVAGLDWSFPSAAASESVEPTPALKGTKLVKWIIAETGREAGLSETEIDALLWIAYRESRYHPKSHSRSNCHGLFQLSKGMAHGKPWDDPEWNTRRAIKYMRGRYGGVLQAKAFWKAHHWY